jgi:hypothetical protein
MPEELFDGIDLGLPDEQLAEWLTYVLDQRVEIDSDDNSTVTISLEEIEALQRLSREAGPKTRRVAASFLFSHGPCAWIDLEAWILDASKDVREDIIGDISTFGDHTVGGRLCSSDRKRCIDLIAKSCEIYPEESYLSLTELYFLAGKEPEWLELSWEAANRLLDIGNEELNTALTVCYFEHIIPDQNWGPDDRRVGRWLSGSDSARKQMLLQIAAYQGLDSGKMREIVEALTHAKDKQIASIAEGVLAGRVNYEDIN